MAFIATHIKFSLDLLAAGYFKISNFDEYLSGTTYPDSRYTTKTARELTHPTNLLVKKDDYDDFTKGWHSHLLYDQKLQILHTELFSSLLNKDKDNWVNLTALKILEDILVFKTFDIQPLLSFLKTTHTPNNEKIDDILKWHSSVNELYKNKKDISIDDCLLLCHQSGMPPDKLEEIKKFANKINTPDILQKLSILEPLILKQTLSMIT